MSFMDGFIGGAAEQATGILNNQMRDEATLDKQQALAQFDADLSEKKERALLQLRQEMADAPLNRIGAKAKEFAGQEVPLEAAPVTDLSATPGAGGLVTGGMRGNYAELQAKAKDLPEEDRQPYLDQIKRQFDSETETAKAGILGQTRKRTADEALGMAAEDAMVNDPAAYAEYQAKIEKPAREDRRIDSLERKDDLQEKKNDAYAAEQSKRSDWMQTHQTEVLELQREVAKQNAQRGAAGDKDPAGVSTARWLAANKDDPVMMEAWEKANHTKSKDVKSIAVDLMAKSTYPMEPSEAVAKARALVEAADAPKKATDTPNGMTLIGHTPDGKPVYRNAAGKQVVGK